MKKKMKISNPVNEEYETQLKIPKPILMDIFQRCGLENFLKISLISKQFYFLLKSDNFWLKMLKTTDLNEIELDSMRKSQSLVEIYRDTLDGWDVGASHKSLTLNGKKVSNELKGSTFAAVTKKKFVTGQDNVLFIFDYLSNTMCASCGVIKEGR